MPRRRLSRVAARYPFADLPRASRRHPLSIVLCAAAMLALATLWQADNAQAGCVLVGTTETCTGDTSGGANFTNTPHPLTVDTLNANNLTNSIAPPSNTRGLGLSDVGDHGPNGNNGAVGIGSSSGDTGGAGSGLSITYSQPGATQSTVTSPPLPLAPALAAHAHSRRDAGCVARSMRPSTSRRASCSTPSARRRRPTSRRSRRAEPCSSTATSPSSATSPATSARTPRSTPASAVCAWAGN